VRVLPDRDAFVVANKHPGIARIYQDTEWAEGLAHMRVLRRLPGVEACGPQRWQGLNIRGTIMPAAMLDEH
jgi:hypothetical protein